MGNDRSLWLDILFVSAIGIGAIWWLVDGGPVPHLAVKPVTPAEDLKTFDEVQEEIRQNGEYVPAITPTKPDTNKRRNALRRQLKAALDDLEVAPCSRYRAELLAKEITVYTRAIRSSWNGKAWRTAADQALWQRIQALISTKHLAVEDFEKAPPIAGLRSRQDRDPCD